MNHLLNNDVISYAVSVWLYMSFASNHVVVEEFTHTIQSSIGNIMMIGPQKNAIPTRKIKAKKADELIDT